MRVINVAVNGEVRWRAGMANASIIAAHLSAWVADDLPASLSVSGMCDLDQGRAAHVYWCENVALAEGDTVAFTFTDADNVTPPGEMIPTDAPEHIKEQRAFAESLKTFVPDRAPAVRNYPGLSVEYRLHGQSAATASLVGGEEHIVCSLLWIKQRPDQCRISVHSFGDKAKPENAPATKWLDATLSLDNGFSVRIAS